MKNPSRTALVTGGSRGIGRATVLDLAARDVDVILTYRSNEKEAADVAAEVEAMGGRGAHLAFDASDHAQLDDFVAAVRTTLTQAWGVDRLDFLVNNAGSQRTGGLAEVTEADFDELVNSLFKSVMFLTQKLATTIRDGGSIVNVTSGVTRFYSHERIAYASVKGAVEVMTRYLAQELGPRGITVNAVAPGAVATDFSGGLLRDNTAVQKLVSSVTALGRYAVPEDVSGAIASLLTGANGWVTGQRIEVSGGVHL